MGADPAAVGKAVVDLARVGRFAEVEDLFDARLRAAVSADTLQLAWAVESSKIGPVLSVGEPQTEAGQAGLIRVTVAIVGERGGFAVVMGIDEAGILNGLRFAPVSGAWAPPSYAAPSRFTEQEVVVGSAPSAVAGTLTLPRDRGRRPGVVLLAGGGPFDRDETSGANKPLKDLAWGLASRGVAVLRFDKVIHANPAAADAPGFTMSDEYVPHAVAAVRMLQGGSTVDPAQVFVLGHSMGGKVAPRVAAVEPSVAGLVILAGDTQPMHRAAIRVARYLASLDPSAATSDAIEAITRQSDLVDSPDLSASTPARDLPFGLPGSYWLDLRGYDPVSTAAALDLPMLVIQGGRDYQVTVADDLSRWQAGLADRTDVTIRVYPADNHLFFPGEGRSTPAEYEPPQHVDAAVVVDIAAWLGRG